MVCVISILQRLTDPRIHWSTNLPFGDSQSHWREFRSGPGLIFRPETKSCSSGARSSTRPPGRPSACPQELPLQLMAGWSLVLSDAAGVIEKWSIGLVPSRLVRPFVLHRNQAPKEHVYHGACPLEWEGERRCRHIPVGSGIVGCFVASVGLGCGLVALVALVGWQRKYRQHSTRILQTRSILRSCALSVLL